MENILIIAVDPGANGAVCSAYFNIATGELKSIAVIEMPKDIGVLDTYVGQITQNCEKAILFIEQIMMFKTDAQDNPGKAFRLQKLHDNVSKVKTVFILKRIKVVEVAPVHWQSFLKLRQRGVDESQTVRKNRYKDFAQETFPMLGKLNLKKSDACCILEYARRKLVFDLRKYIN